VILLFKTVKKRKNFQQVLKNIKDADVTFMP